MAERPQPKCPGEKESLELAHELVGYLARAVKSLDEKQSPGPEANYLAIQATHVLRLADAYLFLRRAGAVYPSKFMVRPCLEAIFSVVAVLRDPGFFFREAYAEFLKDKKYAARDPQTQAEAVKAFNDFEKDFKKRYPKRPAVRDKKPLSIRDAATAARMLPLYNHVYALYCNFEHASLRAVSGGLSELTDPFDGMAIIWFLLIMLDQLKGSAAAEFPDITPIWNRVKPPE